MAGAFDDDLFNVFDEDASTSRPTPDLTLEAGSQGQNDSKDRDDSQRYCAALSSNGLVKTQKESETFSIQLQMRYIQS